LALCEVAACSGVAVCSMGKWYMEGQTARTTIPVSHTTISGVLGTE
jgi:hypothetical protein